MAARPPPVMQLRREGVHPHPGPRYGERCRGEREGVLGAEADAAGVYSRQPLTQLQAALGLGERYDQSQGDPCSKQIRRNLSR